MVFVIATIAASTGPTPTPASNFSTSPIFSFTEAVGVTLFPDTIVNS